MPTLMRQINIVSRCSEMYRAKRLRDTDLGACHTAYILSVCHNPGISQDMLARRICINRSNVTRQLAYLEEHGYVTRRGSDSDRRVILVYPTDKALSVLPLVQEIVAGWNDYVTEGLTADELSVLEKLMSLLALRAREYSDSEAGNE